MYLYCIDIRIGSFNQSSSRSTSRRRVCDLLWSDPEEDVSGWRVSSRGCGYIFGGDIVSKVKMNVLNN